MASSAEPTPLDEMPFGVVDVETTGFSPRLHDRVIEIAVIRISPTGEFADEYVTLVNPLRDVGPTHIHGITATDVAQAPTFAEILGDVVGRLGEAIFVAHNVPFDRGFLAAEFSMAGVFLPDVPSLCTLQLAYRLHPELLNHKLATCCQAAGLHHARAHLAVDDARAVAELLLAYVGAARREGLSSLADLGCSPLWFPTELWPSLPASGRRAVRRADGGAPTTDVPFLARVVASLSSVSVAAEHVAPYIDLLDRVLEDRIVGPEEGEALHATAREWGLSREEVIAAHHSYLESLIATALADGRVSATERRDLDAVTRLLALEPSMLEALLSRAEQEFPRSSVRTLGELPADSLAGKSVCFTGSLTGALEGRVITRDVAHDLAQAAGLRVTERVTKHLDLLVVADPNTQSGKARQARRYGTRMMAEAAFWLAIGVQVD